LKLQLSTVHTIHKPEKLYCYEREVMAVTAKNVAIKYSIISIIVRFYHDLKLDYSNATTS